MAVDNSIEQIVNYIWLHLRLLPVDIPERIYILYTFWWAGDGHYKKDHAPEPPSDTMKLYPGPKCIEQRNRIDVVRCAMLSESAGLCPKQYLSHRKMLYKI